MTSHSGRSFLNSCLKVPIDPCNNCPAPIYNRPRMCLGRLSMTPTTAVATTMITTKTCDTETDPKWSCSGIRSLAKFYDSIPDYGELNHLTEEEFYSTLDTLRSTCRELKIKSTPSGISVAEDRSSTTSSSLSSSHYLPSGSQSKKSKKAKKKKRSSSRHNQRKYSESQDSESILDFTNARTNAPDSGYTAAERKTCESFTSKSLKIDLDDEVKSFKKTLKDFEADFKRPVTSSLLNRKQSRSFVRCPSNEPKENIDDFNKTPTEKVPIRSTFTSTLRERLRKSLSFNDLNSMPDPAELVQLRSKTKTLEKLSFKGDRNAYQDPSKLSNYFQENPKSDMTGNIPKIVVDTPSKDSSREWTESNKKSKNKSKHDDRNYKIPFKIFNLDSPKREGYTKHNTPSPVHPVARPNLAATLRAECSKKKVKELKNNCTYHDTTPQFDWEVRKTPAWKTLSLNETHKEILAIRVATRKAEQDLQKREYELNMELMRQRVKSAPLLLEGPTYWGPNVGKLTHSCQKDGRRHMCQSNQQRMRRKKNSSRSHSCRRGLFSGVDYERHLEASSTSNANKPQDSSRMSQKLNTLRKIYAVNANNTGTKSQSRCSNQSTNTQHSSKSYVVKKKSQEKKNTKLDPNLVVLENDSGDELSSLDRAFL